MDYFMQYSWTIRCITVKNYYNTIRDIYAPVYRPIICIDWWQLMIRADYILSIKRQRKSVSDTNLREKNVCVEFRAVQVKAIMMHYSTVNTGSIWPYETPVVQARVARSAIFPSQNIICKAPLIQLSQRALCLLCAICGLLLIRNKVSAFKSCTFYHKKCQFDALKYGVTDRCSASAEHESLTL